MRPASARPRLVLASASPRRRDLLDSLGLAFEVRPVPVDESPLDAELPEAYVRRLAVAKAEAAARPGELVLAADTAVVLNARLLGKPASPAAARAMLAALQGRTHRVLTGVALRDADRGRQRVGVTASRVKIAAMDAETIAWYVATGEPTDKAGAYAIQGLGALFVESVTGNYTNVVGLPLPTVARLARALGYDLTAFRRSVSPPT